MKKFIRFVRFINRETFPSTMRLVDNILLLLCSVALIFSLYTWPLMTFLISVTVLVTYKMIGWWLYFNECEQSKAMEVANKLTGQNKAAKFDPNGNMTSKNTLRQTISDRYP